MTEPGPWYADGRLRFAVGVEDTFVPQETGGQRALDEYELMQHYRFWRQDIALAAESGASLLRWGIPWYRVNPKPGVWEWDWVDRAVDAMVEEGLDLIADLVHYGTPGWLRDEFANPDYPNHVAEYASRVAERYRGRIRHYTPLNEPLLNAMYCGEFGHWPPHLTGDRGFTTVLRSITRGIVQTQQAIAVFDPSADFVHVEASFRFAGATAAHRDMHAHLSHRAYVVQDLVMGRVGAEHPLASYLGAHGFSDDDLAWAQVHTAQPDVIGVNYYPQHSTELFEADRVAGGGPGDLRPRQDAGTQGLKEVLRAFAERYGKPILLSETGYTGTDAERGTWLESSVDAVHELRADGVDVVGYTWWSLTDMFDWSYRYGRADATDYLLRMGLWRLVPDATGAMQRVRTPVADRFRALAT